MSSESHAATVTEPDGPGSTYSDDPAWHAFGLSHDHYNVGSGSTSFLTADSARSVLDKVAVMSPNSHSHLQLSSDFPSLPALSDHGLEVTSNAAEPSHHRNELIVSLFLLARCVVVRERVQRASHPHSTRELARKRLPEKVQSVLETSAHGKAKLPHSFERPCSQHTVAAELVPSRVEPIEYSLRPSVHYGYLMRDPDEDKQSLVLFCGSPRSCLSLCHSQSRSRGAVCRLSQPKGHHAQEDRSSKGQQRNQARESCDGDAPRVPLRSAAGTQEPARTQRINEVHLRSNLPSYDPNSATPQGNPYHFWQAVDLAEGVLRA